MTQTGITSIITAAIVTISVIRLIIASKNKTKSGINLKRVYCPACKTKQPFLRVPGNIEQTLYGGTTCPKCKTSLDKYGNVIGHQVDEAASAHIDDQDLGEMVKQLKIAIGWTDFLCKDFNYENGSYGKVFRSTNPIIADKPLYKFDDDDCATFNLNPYDRNSYLSAFQTAIAIWASYPVNSFEKGRILCFQTGFTTHDGIAPFESQCLIDDSDVPPIDTWFYIDQRHNGFANSLTIFCWIPEGFHQVMQKGIDSETMGSYYWLDEHDPILNNRIFALLKEGV